jgi:WD40 repeat protein
VLIGDNSRREFPAPNSRPFRCGAFSPTGAWIALGSGNDIVILDTQMQPVATLSGHYADVNSVLFSPDGNRLFSASSDFTIRVWDTSSLMSDEPRGTVGEVAANQPADSKAADELDRFRVMLTLEGDVGHGEKAVTSVVFSTLEDKPFLVSVGEDGCAVLWPSSDYRRSPRPMQ